MKNRLPLLVLLVFFFSGACALVYEIVWLKVLSLVFGVTTLATATTLAAFMAGLGLGSYYFGRLAERIRRPLRLYGILELGIALFAFLMPIIFIELGYVYKTIYRDWSTDYFLLSLARLLLSFSVMLIPTFFMGGTLPAISRFLVNRNAELGKRISQLYFINTLGGVLGTLAAGFSLIFFLGLRETAYIAGLLNVLLALTAFFIDRKCPDDTRLENRCAENQPTVPSQAEELQFPRYRRLILWAVGISGFCSLCYEVLWTRVLVYILDNTAQAFTTMLTAFLLGIAFGSLIVSRWLDKGKRLILIFGSAEFLIGIFALLSVPIFVNLSGSIGTTGGSLVYPTNNQALWAFIRLARSLVVMLVPTLIMGMTIPLAIRIFSVSVKAVSDTVGRVYAFNTFGGVIGSFGAGLVLIPLMGIYGSVLLVAGINALVGLTLVLSEKSLLYVNKIKFAGGLTLTFAVTLVVMLSQGKMTFSSAVERVLPYDLLYYKEGAAATVKVYEDAFGAKSLSIDGFPVAGTITRHVDAQLSLGHLPFLLNQKDNPDLNIIGFGAGGSSWAATLYDPGRIDVVELVPDVIEAARLIPEVNHGVMDDSDVNIIPGDGRNYLMLTDRTYDIISVDATSPKSAGSGSLYSVEFYDSCKSHLSANGLMIEWLPYHLLTESDVKMVIRTFQSVFPHASLWYSFNRHYYLLVGTQVELAIDFTHLEEQMSREEIRQDVSTVGVSDAYDVLACFLMGEQGLRRYAGDGFLNTDDHPRLEYDPATAYLNVDDHVRQNLNATRLLRENVSLFIFNISGTDPQLVKQEIAERIAATPIERFWPDYIN